MGKKNTDAAKGTEKGQPPPEEDQPKLEIDYEGIYAHQKKLELLCEQAEHDKSIEYFSKIKYKQNIYQIG